MTFKQAENVQPGDIVREAWMPGTENFGMVLSKTLVHEEHLAKTLCHKKDKRYDMHVHWLHSGKVRQYQNWEIMLVEKKAV
tara:strand:+ start:151 stop:393 length:243 start_codon:yes stop_codon:yes gene_type:complete